MVTVTDRDGVTTSRTLASPHPDHVDRPLAVDVPHAGETAWLLADHQQSVTHALWSHRATISAGVTYTAFGGLLGGSRSGGSVSPGALYGYTGRLWDPHAGLGGMYQYRARWYDAASGRFASPDPAGLAAGDSNLYRYLSNQPTSATRAYASKLAVCSTVSR